MKKRIIGVSGFHFSERQMQELKAAAADLGLEIREIPHGTTELKWFEGCEALAGDYDLSAVNAAPDLRWFHSDWAGVEALIKLPVFCERGAILTNSAGAYGLMITEHLLAGALMLLRHFPEYLDAQRRHAWIPPLGAESLSGKRITVLGLGNVGRSFAQAAHLLGARISGMDLLLKEKPAWLESLFTPDGLCAALAETQILVMCLPHTKETERLIGPKEIGLLPKGALLLNAGRGQTLDTAALTRALQSGHLGGAMLDVFPTEPIPEADPLWDTPRLIITPHVAGHASDQQNVDHIHSILMDNLHRWGRNEPLRNVVVVSRGY